MTWAKLSEAISEDEPVADLLVSNPLAVALFAMSLPRADLYGILPGSARLYRARVCPAADLTLGQIADVIATLTGAGFYHAYQANGHEYLYVRRYHRYQDVRWDRIGPPASPLPDCWDCPEKLRESAHFLRLLGHSAPDTPGHSRSTPGVSRLDVDVDVDVDTDFLGRNPLAQDEALPAKKDGDGQRQRRRSTYNPATVTEMPPIATVDLETCRPDWDQIFQLYGDEIDNKFKQPIRDKLAEKTRSSKARSDCGAKTRADMAAKLIRVLCVTGFDWTDTPSYIVNGAARTAADWYERELREAGPSPPPDLPSMDEIQPLTASPKGDRDNGKHKT